MLRPISNTTLPIQIIHFIRVYAQPYDFLSCLRLFSYSMKIVVVKKVVYTTILTEIGQIVVWTTFRTTTFSPSIKTTILQFALIFVKILLLQQSLFTSELFCQRYSDEAQAKINFDFILFLQAINQNSIFYRNRLELVHGLDPSCAGANRLEDDLFSPGIAVHLRFRYHFIYF